MNPDDMPVCRMLSHHDISNHDRYNYQPMFSLVAMPGISAYCPEMQEEAMRLKRQFADAMADILKKQKP